MAYYFGIDTSNYTTSAAVYDTDTRAVTQVKKLLTVRPGERGLRQSDAVFQHTRQLPELTEQLFSQNTYHLSAVGVSAFPRRQEGSYMPCFLVGEGTAGPWRLPADCRFTGSPIRRDTSQRHSIPADGWIC